jgi:hypothetical protein
MTTARSAPARALATVALLVLVPGLPALSTPAAAQVPEAPDRPIPIFRDGRPFRHADHRAVTCGDCHRPEERHRDTRVWTARDCEACHHGTAAPAGCTSCHERASYEPPRGSVQTLALSVWPEPRDRELVFEHERHADLGCLECHRGGMGLPAQACATCHLDHHRPEAECARCHVAPDPAVHDLAAHMSCGGAGCHAAAATERPMTSRPFCLVCHTDQQDHRPGRSCVACHVKPQPTPREMERPNHGDL